MAKQTTPTSRDITIRLPKPHAGQQELEVCPARFIVVDWGRRGGKTEYVKRWLSRGALGGPGRAAVPVSYMTPKYKLAAEVWRSLRETLAPVTAWKSETEFHLELITGGSVDVWTMQDEDAALGRKYGRAAIDEAASFPKLQQMWERNIRPTLSDLRGKALFTSTPRGHNYFWQLYQRGQDPLWPHWASFQYPTSVNPYIQPGEIEDARRELPERMFRQEYLAEFIDDAGVVFQGVGVVSILLPYPRGFVPGSGARYVMGLDWGKDVDFTAVSVMNAKTLEQVWLERFNQIGWTLQRERVKRIYDMWQPVVLLAEQNSIGGPNIEELRKMGIRNLIPFQTTAQSKGPLIEALAVAIEQRRIKLLDDPVQRNELMTFGMQRLPSGSYRYEAPPGGHDDTVIALALSLEATTYGSADHLMRRATVIW